MARTDRMRFEGRWVLVTGASSGLGLSLARLLANEEHANLVVVARREQRLQELKAELEPTGVLVVPVVADLSRPEGVEGALAAATRGRQLYAAVLNAGVTHFGPHDELSWEAFQAMLATNVTAVARMASVLLPHIESSGLHGGLLLVASMGGITPVPYQSAYAGTKAFLVNFGCSLWYELRGRPVSLTTYAPSGIHTEMTAKEQFGPLRGWSVSAETAAREALEGFRRRRCLYVPKGLPRLGALLAHVAPRFFAGQLAVRYRRALVSTGHLGGQKP